MNDSSKFNSEVSLIWSIADLLNGNFKKSEFYKIIQMFTTLRRFDYALEATKEKVLDTEHKLKEKGLENLHGYLCRASGYAFYNTSKFSYGSYLHKDVRWKWSGFTWMALGRWPCDKGIVHQFGAPPKGNAKYRQAGLTARLKQVGVMFENWFSSRRKSIAYSFVSGCIYGVEK